MPEYINKIKVIQIYSRGDGRVPKIFRELAVSVNTVRAVYLVSSGKYIEIEMTFL